MQKSISLLAKVNTKSNFRQLNDIYLNVDEIQGNRVTCLVYDHDYKKYIRVDFNLLEVTDFKTIQN
jgi:hypothetical protein